MKLYKHQQDAVNFALQCRGIAALFMGLGTGKTLTAIEIVRRLNAKALVICPLSLINAAWGADCAKARVSYTSLRKKPVEAQISTINYESVYKIDTSPYNMVILDESAAIKTHNAKRTKYILKNLRNKQYKLILSGCPAPNSEAEYWAQIYFLSNVLGNNFYKFRNTYFHLQRGRQVMRGSFVSRAQAAEIFSKGWKYAITEQKRRQLMARIAPLCFWKDKSECVDLPDEVDEVRHIYMPLEQMRLYNDMRRNLVAEIQGSVIAAPVMLAKIMKLREITSGFVIDSQGEHKHISDAKLRELLRILEEAGRQQVIIWGQFTYEIEHIAGALGGKAVTLYGRTKHKDEAIETFQSGRAQYLVANPHSAGHGLTFVNCSVQVFYSLDYSYEAYFQARGRTHRIGQINKCTYIHLVAEGTIDEDILCVIRRKGKALEIAREWLRRQDG